MMPSKSNTTAARAAMTHNRTPKESNPQSPQRSQRKPGAACSASSAVAFSLGSQRNHRIDGRRAARRQITGRDRDERQEQRSADEAEGIGGTHVVQEARHQARDAECARDPKHDSRTSEPRAV